MLALGCLIGAVQGFFIAYEGIPAFIVTLAGLSVIRGVALLITGGYSIPIEPTSAFVEIGRGWLLGVPVPAWIALARSSSPISCSTPRVSAAMSRASAPTRRRCRRAGVDVKRTLLFVYMLSSTGAALAGIVLAARLGSGSSNSGQGFELDVIAAVVLGGTSLFGGRGTMVGTVLGALTVAVIANGLISRTCRPS